METIQNNSENGDANGFSELSELSFDNHSKDTGRGSGDWSDDDEETLEKDLQEYLDNFPEKHTEWVKNHINDFDEYVANGKGHYFLDFKYIGPNNFDYHVKDSNIQDGTPYDNNYIIGWLRDMDKEGEREPEEYINDTVDSISKTDKFTAGLDETGKKKLEVFSNIESYIPCVFNYWLKNSPESFAATDDPELIEKIRNNSFKIANSNEAVDKSHPEVNFTEMDDEYQPSNLYGVKGEDLISIGFDDECIGYIRKPSFGGENFCPDDIVLDSPDKHENYDIIDSDYYE